MREDSYITAEMLRHSPDRPRTAHVCALARHAPPNTPPGPSTAPPPGTARPRHPTVHAQTDTQQRSGITLKRGQASVGAAGSDFG